MQSPVITNQQFAAIFDIDIEYSSVLLSRMVAAGDLIRISRGKFALGDTNILAISTNIHIPSYVSLWKAFEHHGCTTQMPRVIDVINSKKSGNSSLKTSSGAYLIKFVKTHPFNIFGFEKVLLDGKTAMIADREKAIVDGLLFVGQVPVDEIFSALKSGVDVGKIVGYAARINKQAVSKRLGFLMDRAGYCVPQNSFPSLSDTYVPVDPQMPRRGKHHSKWRVMENTVIE